jgi:hypothetical protein
MPRLALIVCILLLTAAGAYGQTGDDPRGWGYGFGAVGGDSGNSTANLHAGGGGEGLIYKGFGLGAEVGYISPFRSIGNGVGILSTNVAYHFVNASSDQKLVPFVTGGFSLAFRGGSSGGGNFGGGVQYWMRPHVGLRFEFRDHLFSSDSPHLYGFRVGVSFK